MGYLTVKNFTYTYPEQDKPALSDISFSLEQGETLLLLGKSGSGKSTLGKAVTGTVPYFYGGTASGQVSIRGTDLREMEHNQRSRTVSMVFQYPEKQLILNKVHREVAFGLENIGVPEQTIRRRVFEAMQFTGITPLAEREISTLSGGQIQKVAIASALAFFPECIVLDEPISQLDPLAAEEILNLVQKINEELNITVVLIEQRTGKCFNIADKVAFIEEGKLTFFGETQEFFARQDSAFEPFLPEQVRLFRALGSSETPLNTKQARRLLAQFPAPAVSPKEKTAGKSTQPAAPAIVFQNVSTGYGKANVLERFSAVIGKGESVALLGANGAGKTTLLKTLVGLRPFKGNLLLNGTGCDKMKQREIARTIGYVSQNPDDYLTQETVRDELLFTARHLGITDFTTVVDLMDELSLTPYAEQNPRDLSGGQKQRVAIASALVASPEMLVLDEPTRGIDPSLKQSLAELLKKLNRKGVTILLVTHDVEFACVVSNRFWILYKGQLLADGPKEEVFTESLFYTTAIHKLCAVQNPELFTLKEAIQYFCGEAAQ